MYDTDSNLNFKPESKVNSGLIHRDKETLKILAKQTQLDWKANGAKHFAQQKITRPKFVYCNSFAKANESSIFDQSFNIEFSESIDDHVEAVQVKVKSPEEIENEMLME